MTLDNRVDDSAQFARIRIGSGIGLVNGHTFALLDASNGGLADRLWSAAVAGAGVGELLEELSATGLRSLGDFVMAEIEDGGIRIVVRGSATATVRSEGTKRIIQAVGVKTWVEEIVESADWFELALTSGLAEELPFRLNAGLVPADVMRWSRTEAGDTGLDGVDLAWVDGFEPVALRNPPEHDKPNGTEQRDDSATTIVGQAGSVPVALPEPEARPVSESPEMDPGLTITSGEVAVAPNSSSEIQPSADVPSGDEEYDYDALFGRTVAKSVQNAAVDVEEDNHEEGDELADGQSLSDPAPQLAADKQAAVPIVPAGSLIDLVPPTEGTSEQSPDPGMGDHDGHTMSIAQLRALRARAGAEPAPTEVSPPAMGGPTVQAVLCASGHANPAHFAKCRICGQGLSAAPVIVARPKMGRLVMSSGQVVVLDRPAIIGRKPKAEGRMPNEVPQLIALEVGQGLSRSHAMIHLEQWQVLLEDLDSANGTIVTLPGREPRRLHAGEPVLLEHGTIVDLGGEVTATVDLMN